MQRVRELNIGKKDGKAQRAILCWAIKDPGPSCRKKMQLVHQEPLAMIILNVMLTLLP